MEAFVSELPRGVLFVSWSVPPIVAAVLGDGHPGDWICRHFDSFERAAATAGYKGHVRHSKKKIQDAHRKRDEPLDSGQLMEWDREYSMSTQALIVHYYYAVVHTAAGISNRSQQTCRRREMSARFGGLLCWQRRAKH